MIDTYHGLKLDDFQREAIYHLDQGMSVFVSAPTGTGKTLIADYIIEKDFAAGSRVIYTAPIKALSNQKYKQFKALVGEANVGLVTGDVVTNESAPIVLMTTEIFRNMLLESNDSMEDVAHVIFDEIHYIADEERGFVWEESLIFMPEHMQFLGLSATVPNADQLAQWMGTLRAEPIKVVKAFDRVVPLEHRFYSPETGICSRKTVVRYYKRHDLGQLSYQERQQQRRARMQNPPHIGLLKELGPDYLPVLFFVFSRRGTEQLAQELSAVQDYLTPGEKAEVEATMERHLEGLSVQGLISVERLRDCLVKGIAFHHAGMLPALKEVVEELFERRLVKVLYATETFAVGVNFPVRTVCFESYRKFDGRGFRALTNNEYFQMAGRAGRRGIDAKGYVFVNVAFDFFDPNELIRPNESRLEPVQSQFVLSYNSVLNMIQNHSDGEIRELLKKNLLVYQSQSEVTALQAKLDELTAELAEVSRGGAGGNEGRDKRVQRRIARIKRARKRVQRKLVRMPNDDRIYEQFQRKKELMEALRYVSGQELTARGKMAANMHIQELLVTELYFAGVFHDFTEDEINALAVSIDYEPRRNEMPKAYKLVDFRKPERIARRLQRLENTLLGEVTVTLENHLHELAYLWSQGADFAELLEMEPQVTEGDLISAFRRAIDLLRQLRRACQQDRPLADKLSRCIEKLDRDVVEIRL